ncbi:MAG: glycosyltransferase family 4 protein [Promethearchaeota archaeon]
MNLLLTFTTNSSLKNWNDKGILSREVLLYQMLSQKDIKISFLTYGDKSDLNYTKNFADITVIPCRNYVKATSPILTYFRTVFLPIKLRKLVLKADIIKTNQVLGGIVGLIAKIIYRRKLIVRGGYERLYNYMVKVEKKGIKNLIKYFINYFIIYLGEFFIYRMADHIILSNEPDISFIRKRFFLKKKEMKNQLHHFYNYIDINLFKPLKVTRKDKSVLYVGRLTRGKNLFNLIKAFRELNGFSLDFIGTGPLKSKLKEKAKSINPNINFLGLIQNEKLPEIINQYQIFIIPSYFEGNPKVLLEAMSCGIACIGSNIKGINNIIDHGVNGYLCDLDASSIKDAIRMVYQSNQLRDKMGQNARRFIEENCNLDLIVTKEFELYKSILKK